MSFICIALFYARSSEKDIAPTDPTAAQQGYAAYLKAISEPNAALRRARLEDFLRVYPLDDRSFAAQGQLGVLRAYETRDWNYITKIAYEDSLSNAVRLRALEEYNQLWGGDLLGGRAEDVQSLRENIINLPDTIPKTDRRLEEGPSPIPRNIISDRLLGEPRRRLITPPPPPPVRMPVTQARPKDVIVAPTVRRNVTPRYPSKALRRKIDALVVLRLNVDARGRVKLTELVEVQAPRYQKSFIKAAERAALRTRYNPQTVNGKPVPVQGVLKRYRFKSGG